MYRRWSLCTLYLHACQARFTVGDSGLCCCTCVAYFEWQLTPLCVDPCPYSLAKVSIVSIVDNQHDELVTEFKATFLRRLNFSWTILLHGATGVDHFVERGHRSGPFLGRGNRSESFWGRGNKSGPFLGRGNKSGPFWGRGNKSGPFWGRGNKSGPFWGRGNKSGPFGGRGNKRGVW